MLCNIVKLVLFEMLSFTLWISLLIQHNGINLSTPESNRVSTLINPSSECIKDCPDTLPCFPNNDACYSEGQRSDLFGRGLISKFKWTCAAAPRLAEQMCHKCICVATFACLFPGL